MAKKMTAAEKKAFAEKMRLAREKKAKSKAKKSPAKSKAKSKAKASQYAPKSTATRLSRVETAVAFHHQEIARHDRAIKDVANVQTFMFNELQRGGLFGGSRSGSRDTMVDMPRARGGRASAN